MSAPFRAPARSLEAQQWSRAWTGLLSHEGRLLDFLVAANAIVNAGGEITDDLLDQLRQSRDAWLRGKPL